MVPIMQLLHQWGNAGSGLNECLESGFIIRLYTHALYPNRLQSMLLWSDHVSQAKFSELTSTDTDVLQEHLTMLLVCPWSNYWNRIRSSGRWKVISTDSCCILNLSLPTTFETCHERKETFMMKKGYLVANFWRKKRKHLHYIRQERNEG